MIKAIIFDYDGVITKGVPDGTLSGRLSKNLGVTDRVANKLIQSIWTPLIKGQITEDEVWRLFEHKHRNLIGEEKRDVWFKWEELKPLPEMINLVKNLITRGYPVGILSNATVSTALEIRENKGYSDFNFVILSCEVGYKKPESEIFKIALNKLPGLMPSEVLFLDDKEIATSSAKEMGFKTILVNDHKKAINEVLAEIKN